MSRALDKEDVASAKATAKESTSIYEAIAQVLTERHSGLLEIELLGKSHELQLGVNYRVDGNSVAIPKSKLVQAFIVARRMLLDQFQDHSQRDYDQIRRATAVILLTDSEHLTAANARKRVLQEQAQLTKGLDESVVRELRFTDSLLTSPLHRHTKSPTLWSHRRWLLELYRQPISLDLVEQDLKHAIIPAAEKHPRNYYAWHHARWLLEHLDHHGKKDTSRILLIVKDWCFKNPSDTSGWSFLTYSLQELQFSELYGSTTSAVCKEVLEFTQSFHWTNESVWVFLRTLVAFGQVSTEERLAFFNDLETLIKSQRHDARAQSILQAANDWCTRHQQGQSDLIATVTVRCSCLTAICRLYHGEVPALLLGNSHQPCLRYTRIYRPYYTISRQAK